MDVQELHARIRSAAESAFNLIRVRSKGDALCGYALYCDADAISVSPAANSCANLQKMVASDPSDAEYYRWSPGEWDCEFVGAEYFNEISRSLMAEAKSKGSRDDIERHKTDVYECCVSVLENMKREGFFGDLGQSGVLVFAISDSTDERECVWIDRLNAAHVASDFRKWINSKS